jgi:hypothetical protein
MPTDPSPTLKMELASIVDVDHLELRVSTAQAAEPTKPDVMLRHPLARVSILRTEVEATPETVIAVDDA